MAKELRKLGVKETGSTEPKPKRGFLATTGLFAAALVLALSAGALTGVMASYYLNNTPTRRAV